MYLWEITILVWPYSTDAGAAVDQQACGPPQLKRHVQGQDILEAYRMAENIAEGIKHNPRVWQTPIVGIVQVHQAADVLKE